MPPLPAVGLQGLISVLASLGTLVQLLVLAALLLASMVGWGIILHKARLLGKANRHSARFQQTMHFAPDLAMMAAAARRFAASPLARLFRTAHQRLEGLMHARGARLDDDPATFSTVMLERLRHILHVVQIEEISRLERGLPFLATTASAAPFLGLFGTVWGIMQAFHAIGQRGGASLAVVGPGISEALVVTAAGLAAAIPAVVAYNHFLTRIRRIDNELDGFVEELVWLFDNRLLHEMYRVDSRSPFQR
ncbi:Tol-Pal system protein TolQ [Candidatus Entotheonellaceae bacterium PAL068K]